MRALFTPYASKSGTWGSTNYLLSIADQAKEYGWECAFHMCDPTAEIVEHAGHPVFRFNGMAPRPYRHPVPDFYTMLVALGFDDLDFFRYLQESEERAVNDFKPDVIISDFRPTAPITAARCDTRLASLAMWATDGQIHGLGDHPLDEATRQIARSLASLKVPSYPALLWNLADCKIVTSFPDFEPELATTGAKYVGLLERRDEQKESIVLSDVPDKLVLAYMSTAPWSNERIATSMARTVESIGATLWCVGNANTVDSKIGQRSRLLRYIPYSAVAPQAKAVIFHGGQGTALATISARVPSLVVPGAHYERTYTAKSMERLGVGKHISVEDLRPSQLAKHLDNVINDPEYSQNLAEPATVLDALPGATGAVDLISRSIKFK